MSDSGIYAGLAESPFLATMTPREREPLRALAALVVGVVAGLIVALVVAIVVFVAWSVASGQGIMGIGRIATQMQASGPLDLPSSLLLLTVTATTNAAFALGFLAVAARFVGCTMRRFLTSAAGIRWRLLFCGLVLAALAISPALIVEALTSHEPVVPPLFSVSPQLVERCVYLVAAVAFLIPAAAAEEVLFRGWLLRQFGAYTRNPIVILIGTGVLFAALHLDFSPGAFLSRTIMGAGFAYMTLRLGGVEFSTGAHAANNILIVLFLEPLTMKTVSTPTPLSFGGAAEDVVLIVGYLVITEAVVRIEALRRWAGVSVDEAPASAMKAVMGG